MKRLYILGIILIKISIHSENLNLGLSNIINPFKDINIEFHREFEDNFISIFSEFSNFEVIYFYRDKNIYDIKKNLNKYKKDQQMDSELLNTLNKFNYSLFCDIIYYEIKKEANFYDNEIIEYSGIIKFNIIIIEGNNYKVVEDENFTIETEKFRDQSLIKNKLIFLIREKLKKYKDSILYFKKKIKILKHNNLFIWFNSGKNDNIKETDILIGYDLDRYDLQEIVKVRIIKSNEDTSIGIILFNNESVTEKITFLKKESSNIELQFGGGFSLSEIERNNLILYPYIDIRLVIPVRIPFFNPVVNAQLNLFFKNSKFIIPFSIETGIQGEFNINRFRFGIGTLVGALFSPDSDLRYQIDSIIVRPYLFISIIVNSFIIIYSEFGYRYCNENILYNNWSIDIEGIYFTFGINFQL